MFVTFFRDNTKSLLSGRYVLEDWQLDVLYRASAVLAAPPALNPASASAKLEMTKFNFANMVPKPIHMRKLDFLVKILLLANIDELRKGGFQFYDDEDALVSAADAWTLQRLIGRRPSYKQGMPRAFSDLAGFVLRHKQLPDWANFERYALFPGTYVFDCSFEIKRFEGLRLPVFASKNVMQILVESQLLRGLVLEDAMALLQEDRFFPYFFVIRSDLACYSTEAFFVQNVERLDINDLNRQLRCGLGTRNYNFEMEIGKEEMELLGLRGELHVALIQRIEPQAKAKLPSVLDAFCRRRKLEIASAFPFAFPYEFEPPKQHSLSLFDSITKQRIGAPARTTLCTHLQAFERTSFDGRCPICGQAGQPFECQFFRYVLGLCAEDVRFVVIGPDLELVSAQTVDVAKPDDGWDL